MRKRHKRRRHARSAVFAGLGLFALSQLLLAVAAETVCSEIRDPNYGARWRVLRARATEEPARPPTIIFGSSRVETGVQPEAMRLGEGDPAVLNFGLTGATPGRAWLAFRRMRDAGMRPDMVVIEVMPALFGEWLRADDAFVTGKLSARDLADLSPYLWDPLAMWRQWLMERSVPIYSSRFVIMSRMAPRWLPIASRTDYLWTGLDRYGAARLPDSLATPSARRSGSLQARNEYADRLRHFALPPSSIGLLHRWIDECRGAGIPAALLLMPESAEFQALYPPAARALLDDFLNRFQTETGVPVIDARDWLPESAHYDGHHLLFADAKQFSARLAVELQRIRITAHR